MNTPVRVPVVPARIDRRTALRWMLTAAAVIPIMKSRLQASEVAPPAAKGYGTDPDLLKDYKPGELWPLTFTDNQRLIAAKLCDLIIPADRESPSATDVGVVDFLDEWISAPYPRQRKDRTMVLDGLWWIDREAHRRFGCDFCGLSSKQACAICDDICFAPRAKLEHTQAAAFFAMYRDLTAGGFYTTPEGTKDLRYMGNMPLATFEGPSVEVLRQVGLS